MKVYSRDFGSIESDSKGFFSMAFLGICFLAGSALGVFVCILISDKTVLCERLLQYFEAGSEDGPFFVSFFTSVWDFSKWFLLVLIIGKARISVLFIPPILAVRGFLLSHAIAVFVYLFGIDGWLIALVAFGLSALIVVPLFFVVCHNYFHSSLKQKGNERSTVFLKSHFPYIHL